MNDKPRLFGRAVTHLLTRIDMVGELKRRAGKPWTEYELSILKAMGSTNRAITIAQRLGRSTAVVRARAAELGIPLKGSDDN